MGQVTPNEFSFGEGHWPHGPSGDWFVSLHPRALETNYEQCRDEMELQAAIWFFLFLLILLLKVQFVILFFIENVGRFIMLKKLLITFKILLKIYNFLPSLSFSILSHVSPLLPLFLKFVDTFSLSLLHIFAYMQINI